MVTAVTVWGVMAAAEHREGFRWDLVFMDRCRRLDSTTCEKRIDGFLSMDFGVGLPHGSRIVNGGDYGPDHEYWFEVTLPSGSAHILKQALVSQAAHSSWRLADDDQNTGGGSGNLVPLWWRTRDLKNPDYFKLSYSGPGHPHGAWTYYFTSSEPGDRLYIWMLFDM